MEIEQIIAIINFILVLFTLYPSIALLSYLIRTRSENKGDKRNLNYRLSVLFLAFTIGALINSILYLFAFLDWSFVSATRHDIARGRSLIVNALFAWTVWGIYLFNKKSSN